LFFPHRVSVKDREIKVNIFDMAGHPIFYEVRNEFYRDTQGAIMVYDVCDRVSFESLDSWLQEMKNEMGDKTECDNMVICVCANKVIMHNKAGMSFGIGHSPIDMLNSAWE